MLVFWNKKLVILSVPKTGSTALETALAPNADMIVSHPPELKHAPLYRYNRFFRPMFERACKTDDMETMAVVREPISWMGSWYRYRQRDILRGQRNSTYDVSFDEFVQAYMQNDQPPFANVGSQAKFIEPRRNGVKVDHLFRYENQARIVSFLQDRLGYDITLERKNSSPAGALEISPETLADFKHRCRAEYEAYESALA